ncbi:hypothetical protein A3Q56_08053, partial [Intoshia linei]
MPKRKKPVVSISEKLNETEEPSEYQKFHQKTLTDNPNVNKNLICVICLNVFQDPMRIHCGHSFCKVCIRKAMKVKKECPLCKIKIDVTGMHEDFIIRNYVEEYK